MIKGPKTSCSRISRSIGIFEPVAVLTQQFFHALGVQHPLTEVFKLPRRKCRESLDSPSRQGAEPLLNLPPQDSEFAFITPFLAAFLAAFLPAFLPAFLAPFLPAFLPAYLTPFLFRFDDYRSQDLVFPNVQIYRHFLRRVSSTLRHPA